MNKPPLAARRAALIERCAEQRTSLACELNTLRPSNALSHPVAGIVVANKKLVLGVLGAGLGMALVRRKRVAALAGSAVSAWRAVQNVRGFLGR